MAKRVLMIGLDTQFARVTMAACQCCGTAFEWFGSPLRNEANNKAVPEFCDECSDTRCDAFPGENLSCFYRRRIVHTEPTPINLTEMVE